MRQSIIQNLNLPQCKLAPSKIPNAGVGVFALTRIPEGYPIFGPKGFSHFISWEEIECVPFKIKEYIRQICHCDASGFWLDGCLDKIDMSYYVNHSENPNLWHDENADVFYADRVIEEGEELTCLYPQEERDWLFS